jgi:Flp pilus assembly protein TadG
VRLFDAVSSVQAEGHSRRQGQRATKKRRLRGFGRNKSGLAVLEFALILPVLVSICSA